MPTPAEDSEDGKLRTALAIVVAVLIFFVMLGAIWVQLSDRLNGLDAYRTKWLIEQRDGYRKKCEDNAKAAEALKEWLRQQNLKPPPDLMVSSACVQPDQYSEKGDH